MNRFRWFGVVAVLGLCLPAFAQYHNDFSSLAGLSTTGYYGSNPSAPYLAPDGQSVLVDVPGYGYARLWIEPAGSSTGTPVNIENGEITITVKYAGPFQGQSGFWFRARCGVWDGSAWVPGVRANYWLPYDYQAQGWQTFVLCVTEPNEYQYGTPDQFDPSSIYIFALDAVFWEGSNAIPYTFGIDDLNITVPSGPAPTADAGPDQNVPGTCGQYSNVTLNGSGSQNAVTYTWFEAGAEIATGPTPTVSMTPGTHYVVLEVTDGACVKDTDEVVINVSGTQPLPIEISFDEQIDYGYGEAIVPDYGVFYQTFTDPETGNNWPWVRTYLVGGDWYYGPVVDLQKACWGTVDLSGPNMALRFSGRYFQDANNWNPFVFGDPNDPLEPYEDSPVGILLQDSTGKTGWLGWLIGPDMRNAPDRYPNWRNVDIPVVINPDPGFTDAGFDLSRVVRVWFFGTDWGGLGSDFVDIRDLWIGQTAPPVCIGDTDCDGFVDFGDINPFVAGLTGGPMCNPGNFDINGNGTVGFDDINPFVAYLSAHQGEACP